MCVTKLTKELADSVPHVTNNKIRKEIKLKHKFLKTRKCTSTLYGLFSDADSIWHGGTSPLLTNCWARGHREWQISKQETDQTVGLLNITKALTKTTKCTIGHM